jgi:hypothetical protein
MAGMQLPLLRTHKVNGTRQPILVTAKAGNQMDGVANLVIGVAKETILEGPQGDQMRGARLHQDKGST